VRSLVESPDALVRRDGVDLVRMTSDADEAARLLRPRAKDTDMQVRSRVQQGIRELHIDDVALPLRNTERWDPSGWSSGNVVHATRPLNLQRWGLPVIADVDALCALLGVAGIRRRTVSCAGAR
jgi:hypothetical protein